MLPDELARAQHARAPYAVVTIKQEVLVAQLRTSIEEHVTFVQRSARRLSRNRADAEDLAQDCFVRALTCHGNNIRNPKAYLFSILRHVHIDRVLHKQRESRDMAFEHVAANLVSEATQHGNLLGRDVMQSIRQLPHTQRDIVRLVCLEGLSSREAAHLLNLPMGTILSRLARARERLQHALA